MKKQFVKKFSLYFIALASVSMVSCSKIAFDEGNAKDMPPVTSGNTSPDLSPRSNQPYIYYTYRGEVTNHPYAGILSKALLSDNGSNATFLKELIPDVQGYSTFQVYSPISNQIFGTRYSIYDKKTLLSVYNIAGNFAYEKAIFPKDDIRRRLVAVDEINKKLYYLETKAGQTAYDRLIKSNFDNTQKTTLFQFLNNIDAVIMDLPSNSFYYASRLNNALYKVSIQNKALTTIVKNLNLAGRGRYIPGNGNKLFPIAIDPDNNKVFWLRSNATSKISCFSKARPSLCKANLDGSGGFSFVKQTFYFSNAEYLKSMKCDGSINKADFDEGILTLDGTNKNIHLFYQTVSDLGMGKYYYSTLGSKVDYEGNQQSWNFQSQLTKPTWIDWGYIENGNITYLPLGGAVIVGLDEIQ